MFRYGFINLVNVHELDLGILSKSDNKKLTTEKIITANAENPKPTENMDCTKLKEFVMSFQK